MRSDTFVAATELTTVNCGNCGGTYAISERFRRQKQERSGIWHCPYCDCEWGFAGSDLENAKKALAAEKKALAVEKAEHDQTAARLRDANVELSSMKQRIDNGVCPYCNRTFRNLCRHMKAKHPDSTAKSKRK